MASLSGTLRASPAVAAHGELKLVLVALGEAPTETVETVGPDGAWNAGELPPGCYRLRVLQAGFDAPRLERDVFLAPGSSQFIELDV